MEPLFKKYQPKSLKEIVGQDDALRALKRYIEAKRKKALLLYGPSGTGKTASAHALANEHKLELREVNASDSRNEEQINKKVGAAIQQHSLFFKGKIILIDEIDGLEGTKDRGALPALIKLIEASRFPIIITITNPYDNKYSKLRSKCELVEFYPLNYEAILSILKNACKKEKIEYDEAALKMLARRAGGDARAALNDLEILTGKNKKLLKESLEELDDREKEKKIIDALQLVLKTTDPKIAISAFDNVKEDINEQMLWLDKNLPFEYEKPEDLARAYDKLSKADVFNRRIKRWQHWRFLVYINALLTGSIATAKDEKYKKFVEYKPTGRLLKIWWANQKLMKKKSIAGKIAEKTNCSTRRAMKDVDYMKMIFRKNKEMSKEIADYLELSYEEVMWMNK